EQARELPERDREAAQGRHVPRAPSQRSWRPVQLSRAVLEHRAGLYEESEGGERFSALVPVQRYLRAVVRLAAGVLGWQQEDLGRGQAVEGRPGNGAVPHSGRKRTLCRLCGSSRPGGG